MPPGMRNYVHGQPQAANRLGIAAGPHFETDVDFHRDPAWSFGARPGAVQQAPLAQPVQQFQAPPQMHAPPAPPMQHSRLVVTDGRPAPPVQGVVPPAPPLKLAVPPAPPLQTVEHAEAAAPPAPPAPPAPQLAPSGGFAAPSGAGVSFSNQAGGLRAERAPPPAFDEDDIPSGVHPNSAQAALHLFRTGAGAEEGAEGGETDAEGEGEGEEDAAAAGEAGGDGEEAEAAAPEAAAGEDEEEGDGEEGGEEAAAQAEGAAEEAAGEAAEGEGAGDEEEEEEEGGAPGEEAGEEAEAGAADAPEGGEEAAAAAAGGAEEAAVGKVTSDDLVPEAAKAGVSAAALAQAAAAEAAAAIGILAPAPAPEAEAEGEEEAAAEEGAAEATEEQEAEEQEEKGAAAGEAEEEAGAEGEGTGAKEEAAEGEGAEGAEGEEEEEEEEAGVSMEDILALAEQGGFAFVPASEKPPVPTLGVDDIQPTQQQQQLDADVQALAEGDEGVALAGPPALEELLHTDAFSLLLEPATAEHISSRIAEAIPRASFEAARGHEVAAVAAGRLPSAEEVAYALAGAGSAAHARVGGFSSKVTVSPSSELDAEVQCIAADADEPSAPRAPRAPPRPACAAAEGRGRCSVLLQRGGGAGGGRGLAAYWNGPRGAPGAEAEPEAPPRAGPGPARALPTAEELAYALAGVGGTREARVGGLSSKVTVSPSRELDEEPQSVDAADELSAVDSYTYFYEGMPGKTAPAAAPLPEPQQLPGMFPDMEFQRSGALPRGIYWETNASERKAAAAAAAPAASQARVHTVPAAHAAHSGGADRGRGEREEEEEEDGTFGVDSMGRLVKGHAERVVIVDATGRSDAVEATAYAPDLSRIRVVTEASEPVDTAYDAEFARVADSYEHDAADLLPGLPAPSDGPKVVHIRSGPKILKVGSSISEAPRASEHENPYDLRIDSILLSADEAAEAMAQGAGYVADDHGEEGGAAAEAEDELAWM
eukprot:tig00000828_g4618.t1